MCDLRKLSGKARLRRGGSEHTRAGRSLEAAHFVDLFDSGSPNDLGVEEVAPHGGGEGELDGGKEDGHGRNVHKIFEDHPAYGG